MVPGPMERAAEHFSRLFFLHVIPKVREQRFYPSCLVFISIWGIVSPNAAGLATVASFTTSLPLLPCHNSGYTRAT